MSLIPEATYPARAVEYEFGTSDNGTEQIGVSFRITQGDYAGRVLTWYGFFNTPENAQRAIKSLRACGWKGDDLATLTGLTENDVNIVVEVDDYQGKVTNKVAWVNGAGVAMKNVMTEQQKKALAARMKGLILAGGGGVRPAPSPGRQPPRNGGPNRAPAPPQDDDYGYGGSESDIPF
jgi:hypothetical protein